MPKELICRIDFEVVPPQDVPTMELMGWDFICYDTDGMAVMQSIIEN